MKISSLGLFAIIGLSSALTTGNPNAPGPSVSTERWKGFCIDKTDLPHGAVDASVGQVLKDTAGNGLDVVSTNQNEFAEWLDGNVDVYLCTDEHHAKNTFTNDDVHRALAAMDLNCPSYTPSWAIYEIVNSDSGTWVSTNKIVGKSWTGTPICQGFRGGMANGDHTGGGAIYWK